MDKKLAQEKERSDYWHTVACISMSINTAFIGSVIALLLKALL